MLTQEESKFNKTIDQGLTILAEMEAVMEKEGKKGLDGKEAFKLYDTLWFPSGFDKGNFGRKRLFCRGKRLL